MRAKAKEKGWKLNEYGLFETKTSKEPMNLNTEKAIFNKLDMKYLSPVNRGD